VVLVRNLNHNAMEHLGTLALALHILAGTTALLSGLFNMIARKGGPRHRRAGTVFVTSMYVVAVSAVILSTLLGSVFFFCLGIFTFYMTWNGQRSARYRTVAFTRMDIAVLVLGTLNNGVMLLAGNYILMGLGVLSATLIVQEWMLLVRTRRGWQAPPLAWLRRHIGMIVGSYISTLTAFLTVNFSAGPWPYWLPWALPSLVLVPWMSYWTWKYVRKPLLRKVPAAAAAVLLLTTGSVAQSYIDGGDTRHRFAQTTLGLDMLHVPSGGVRGGTEFRGRTMGRALIGGTHFWGHADFVLAIPLAQQRHAAIREGVETSFKVQPWRIKEGRITPYIGGAWSVFRIRAGEGAEHERMRVPLLAGVTYLRGKLLLDAGVRHVPPWREDHWLAVDQRIAVLPPAWSVGVSARFMIDTTVGAERDHASGRTRALTDTLAALGRLDGLTLAFGGGTAFFLHRSDWMKENRPWLDDHRISDGYLHGSIGWYMHKPDLQVAVSYRSIKDELRAFGHAQVFSRRSLSLEAYHFFADLHGFAPFAGVSLGVEDLRVMQKNAEREEEARSQRLRPGVVAGWDIRPNRLQAFYLRTQLRFVPGLSAPLPSGGSLAAGQLEVDFIQLVVLPGRFK
jgi:uncharacterized membrane protein